jgi:hypothetical protein
MQEDKWEPRTVRSLTASTKPTWACWGRQCGGGSTEGGFQQRKREGQFGHMGQYVRGHSPGLGSTVWQEEWAGGGNEGWADVGAKLVLGA